jgi:hypothetical protein
MKKIIITGQLGSYSTAIEPLYPNKSRWWHSALQARWMEDLGKSRSRCVVISLLLHLMIVILVSMRFTLGQQVISTEPPSVVPVELVEISDVTNMMAMSSQQQVFSPSEHRVDAPAPKSEATVGIEMRLFPHQPTLLSKSNTADGEGSSESPDQQPPSSLRNAKYSAHDIRNVGKANAMTMSVSDFLRNQILQCWKSTKAFSSRAVTFELYLDGSGSIERPPRLIETAEQTSEDVVIAETVRQAIYTCAPYKLPNERFQEWHRTVLKFDAVMIKERSYR